jgi:energy-converting hydrogenase Eha subunit F
MQNNLGEAPSPCLTPVFILKLAYCYPLIHTIPLLSTYMFLINYTKLYGMLSFYAKSSHKVLRSTRSYALFKSINSSPNGCLAHILYYTSY